MTECALLQSGKRAAEMRAKTKERSMDAKRIQDLERQVRVRMRVTYMYMYCSLFDVFYVSINLAVACIVTYVRVW